ncbi:unnamed protein product [Lactuca saligna]|uniref:Uncharacterized protein n=1 Tax=Lactuca saligna TaxID=75948 RepID=A0AA35VE46_LACSI|nr:unnamed protein product [Lactuca saligna]
MRTDEIIDKSLKSHDGSQVCEDFVGASQTWLSKIKRCCRNEGPWRRFSISDCLGGLPNDFFASFRKSTWHQKLNMTFLVRRFSIGTKSDLSKIMLSQSGILAGTPDNIWITRLLAVLIF